MSVKGSEGGRGDGSPKYTAGYGGSLGGQEAGSRSEIPSGSSSTSAAIFCAYPERHMVGAQANPGLCPPWKLHLFVAGKEPPVFPAQIAAWVCGVGRSNSWCPFLAAKCEVD